MPTFQIRHPLRWGFATVASTLLLSGCASLGQAEGPKPAFDISSDITQLSAEFGSATSIKDYYSQPETAARRNAFVVGRLTLYDLQYIAYVQRFATGQSTVETAFDISKLGVDLSTTLVGRPYTKTVLGVASAALTGSRLSVEKNFFDDTTTAALVSQMNASRKTALVPILAGLQQSATQYPLSTAIVDLQAYYEAGTPQGALMSVQAAAAQQSSSADQLISQYRAVAFAQDTASTAIRRWLYPSASSTGPGGAMLLADGTPARADTARATQLRQWLSSNGWGDLPLERLLDGPTFATARQSAASALNIPPT